MINNDITNRLIEYIDDKIDIFPIYAPPSISTGLILSFPILLSPLGYILLGCHTDWVTVSGFVIDILGAVILAIPDLPKYSEWTYGGRVREAHLRLMNDEKPGRFAPNTRYYEAFTEALRERLAPNHIPENGYFDIEPSKITFIMRVKDEHLDPIGVGPISIGNIERELTEVYRSEEGKFRRLGIFLIIIGFLTQLVSMVIDSFVFIDLCRL